MEAFPTATGPPFRADLARSARLLRAFRTEQSSPDRYYAGLAADTVAQLGQYTELTGRVVADVGGGPGFFVRCSAAKANGVARVRASEFTRRAAPTSKKTCHLRQRHH